MRDADFVKVAKALADPTRFRMLQEIRSRGSLNCSQVCGCFPLSQPTISHHVKALESAGLITVRKEGQYHVLTACELRLGAFTRALSGEEPVTPNGPRTPSCAEGSGAGVGPGAGGAGSGNGEGGGPRGGKKAAGRGRKAKS